MKLTFVTFFIGLLLIGWALFSWITGTYNDLVKLDESTNLAWSKVESQYQRRFDLIPSLVNSVRGYLFQEQEILEAIAEARTHYGGATAGSQQKVEGAIQLETALSRLMVVMENYPRLQSDAIVVNLMDELKGTENRITLARDRYNEDANLFNRTIRSFPGNMISKHLGFTAKLLFKSVEAAATAPKVDLEVNNEK